MLEKRIAPDGEEEPAPKRLAVTDAFDNARDGNERVKGDEMIGGDGSNQGPFDPSLASQAPIEEDNDSESKFRDQEANDGMYSSTKDGFAVDDDEAFGINAIDDKPEELIVRDEVVAMEVDQVADFLEPIGDTVVVSTKKKGQLLCAFESL